MWKCKELYERKDGLYERRLPKKRMNSDRTADKDDCNINVCNVYECTYCADHL